MDDTTGATQYEIRIRGLLSERLLSAFPEMQARMRDHETILAGALPDQSALHGVLGRLGALGLELLEVRRPRTTESPETANMPAQSSRSRTWRRRTQRAPRRRSVR